MRVMFHVCASRMYLRASAAELCPLWVCGVVRWRFGRTAHTVPAIHMAVSSHGHVRVADSIVQLACVWRVIGALTGLDVTVVADMPPAPPGARAARALPSSSCVIDR